MNGASDPMRGFFPKTTRRLQAAMEQLAQSQDAVDVEWLAGDGSPAPLAPVWETPGSRNVRATLDTPTEGPQRLGFRNARAGRPLRQTVLVSGHPEIGFARERTGPYQPRLLIGDLEVGEEVFVWGLLSEHAPGIVNALVRLIETEP